MTQAGNQFDYVTADRFYVEMESEITASFSECSGLGVSVKYETIREGGVNEQQRIILGEPEFSKVTLKRGVTDNLVFWEWLQNILADDKPNQRRNVNILLFNQAGETMQCWTLIGAVPVGWQAPALQADSETVALEELSLAYEGLKIEKRTQGGRAQDLSNGRDQFGYFEGKT